YPPELRSSAYDRLLQQPPVRLQVSTVFLGGEPDFRTVTVDDLASTLHLLHEDLAGKKVLDEAIGLIEECVESFAVTMSDEHATLQRIAEKALRTDIPRKQKQFASTARICAIALLNALMFQEVLAKRRRDIPPLSDTPNEGVRGHLCDVWDHILLVNWYPIFHIARKIAANISVDSATAWYVVRRYLVSAAERLVEKRAALRHDLLGRVYHKLLAQKKFLATYFTSVPAATVLLTLAVQSIDGIDWSEPKEVSRLRVADLACGTGTLLMAAASAIEEQHYRACAEAGKLPNPITLHKALLENSLWGFDVLPFAVHLTASTLALRAPEVEFEKTNLYVVPLGGDSNALGSIEFLRRNPINAQKNLFAEPLTETSLVGPTGETEAEKVALPELDLCVMNPPFTRSVGGNLLFGSVPYEQRRRLQKELAELLRKNRVGASSTAGLGAIFVAIADRHIKPRGIMALVLPLTCLSGPAWQKTRALWASNYSLQWVIASHDPQRWNFSDSTSLSEVLLILRKKENADENSPAKFVVLWRNPTETYDAIIVASRLLDLSPANLLHDQKGTPVNLNGKIVGEAFCVPQDWLKEQSSWFLPVAFAQTLLTKVALHWLDGEIVIPGYGVVGRIPTTRLGDIATLGPDPRDVYDGFEVPPTTTPSPFACFWGHDANIVKKMAQGPNGYLTPLSKPKKSRPLRRTEQLWPKAANLLIAQFIWLNTQRLLAIYVSEKVLSNDWWPCKLQGGVAEEKALCVWLNSSMGIVSLLTQRTQTRGAWVKWKKPPLYDMVVPDFAAMREQVVETLSEAFERLKGKELQPISRIKDDPVRAEIDNAVAAAFGVDTDFAALRTLLANEPVISLARLA
ncbi:MAG: hypothetical protein DRP63_03565, partial [Planctomycetota bacterium]